MPDVETSQTTGSFADNAVAYILRRTQRDPNFRYYMLGTEALARCLKAAAERQGTAMEIIDAIEAIGNSPPALGEGQRKPDVLEYRDRLDKIDTLVAQIQDRGKLTEKEYTALCDAIHGIGA